MQTDQSICNGKDDQGCGGTIVSNRSDGRFYLHKNVYINIPVKISIPRCNKCNTDFYTDKLLIFLDKFAEWEYNEHRELIQEAIERDRYRA